MRIASLVTLSVLLALGRAEAAPRPLDRIVAVVDDRPIFLSELRARAKPIAAKAASESKRPLGDSEMVAMYRELVERMVDELVFAQDAETRVFEASADDIDRALQMIAASSNVTVEAIQAEAERYGFDRKAYREEVRKQIVEGKWSMLVLKPRIKVPPTDQAAFAKALEEERAQEMKKIRARHYIEVRP